MREKQEHLFMLKLIEAIMKTNNFDSNDLQHKNRNLWNNYHIKDVVRSNGGNIYHLNLN